MAVRDKNFFFYTITAKDEDKNEVNLKDLIDNGKLIKNKIEIGRPPRVYGIKFTNLEDNFFFGRIHRSRNRSDFFETKANEIKDLSEQIEKIGEKDRDIVNFVFGPFGNKIMVLMERGYQYPGMGILTEFFQKFLEAPVDKDNVKYEPLKTKNLIEKLKRVSNKPVKSISLTVKKDASIPQNWPIEKTLECMNLPGFEITIQVNIGRVRDKKRFEFTKTKDLIKRIINVPESEAFAHSMAALDLPTIFSSLDITFYEGAVELNKLVTENIISAYEQCEIALDKEMLTETDRLSSRLLKELKQKISNVGD